MEKTLTQILEEVKEDICINYCKYNERCSEALENGDGFNIECPLFRL